MHMSTGTCIIQTVYEIPGVFEDKRGQGIFWKYPHEREGKEYISYIFKGMFIHIMQIIV